MDPDTMTALVPLATVAGGIIGRWLHGVALRTLRARVEQLEQEQLEADARYAEREAKLRARIRELEDDVDEGDAERARLRDITGQIPAELRARVVADHLAEKNDDDDT